MVYNLRKKLIRICAVSIVIVCTAIFAVMVVMSTVQLNQTMDTLTDAIASNNGVFPEFEEYNRPRPSEGFHHADVITQETQYSTRFFTVWLGDDDRIVHANVDYIFSISEVQVQDYAEKALSSGRKAGWVDNYRFKFFEANGEKAIVFVNGDMNRMMSERFILTFFMVLAGSGLVILILVILLSKRAVRPIAESYEKQKQFVTDANHELKTPLTLILTNLDIVEAEVGKNEWLDDIRCEGERMKMLVNQLVMLSRMDEDQSNLTISQFDLSDAISDTVSEFKALAADRQKSLSCQVEPAVEYKGDEGMIRRLVAILMDNAVKYCDDGGEIRVAVSKRHHPVTQVENSCAQAEQVDLGKLFDRFYRADRARSYDGSFGVGLSIARAIARKHRGDILAYRKDGIIGFKVELK